MNHLADIYVGEPKATTAGQFYIPIMLIDSEGAKYQIVSPRQTAPEIRAAQKALGFAFDQEDCLRIRRACKEAAGRIENAPKWLGDALN